MQYRKSWIFVLCLLMFSTSAWAETRYVKDVIYIQLRDNPSDSAKVLKALPSGTVLEVSAEDGQFVKVATPAGDEGWVKERYLVSEPVAAQKLAELQELMGKSEDIVAGFNEKIEALQQRLNETEKERKRLDSLSQRLEAENMKLLEVSKEPMKLSKANAVLQQDNAKMNEELGRLRTEVAERKNNDTQDWFLAGGGVALAGLILGLIIPNMRLRRRSQWS